MKKRIILAGAIIPLVFAAFFGFRWYIDNKTSNFRKSAVIFVYPDTRVDTLLARIGSLAGLKSAASLRRQFVKYELASKLRPGRYEIDPSMSSAYVARALAFGWQKPAKLVISGSLRLRGQLAKKISSQMMIDSASVRNALEDTELLSNFGFTPENVFALFIPDTYEMWWTAPIRDILEKQKKAYDAFWNAERLAKADSLKLSPMQVSVLASIVNQESYREEEFPLVASVYINRLRRGMRLQACPTVMFLYDYTLDRLLFSHIRATKASPFNTYMNDGLPPAPICVPSKAALDSVLNPSSEPYLYFCADARFNGRNVFARSYSEHIKNARAYQKALDIRQREKRSAN